MRSIQAAGGGQPCTLLQLAIPALEAFLKRICRAEFFVLYSKFLFEFKLCTMVLPSLELVFAR